jgi:hypothetical protein
VKRFVTLCICMLAAPAAHAGTCPPRATLDALAKAAWGGAAGQPACTAIRAREPLSFVVDIATLEGERPPRGFDPARDGAIGYAAIIDRQSTVRWHHESVSDTPGDWNDWLLVDLDGDGRDELIAHHVHIGHMGARSEELLLHTIGNGEATKANVLPLADHVPPEGFGQNSCTATYRLVRDGRLTVIEIVGRRGNDPKLTPVYDGACARDGKHVYRWSGKDLVENHPAGAGVPRGPDR